MALLPFVQVGDNHGDEVEPGLEKAFFEWMADFKPKIRVHAGDLMNLAALRRKATNDERTTAIAPDVEAAKDFHARFFDGGQIKVFTRGNHDERLWNLQRSTSDAALACLAGKLITEIEVMNRKRGVKMLPYDSRLGVLDIHGLRTIHGYAAGIGAARKFAFIYGTCAFGHTHSMDVCPAERWPEPSIAYGTGCLCKIDQPYNSTQPGKLRHENGWLYGFTDGKRATYFQAKWKDGKVYVAENIKAY